MKLFSPWRPRRAGLGGCRTASRTANRNGAPIARNAPSTASHGENVIPKTMKPRPRAAPMANVRNGGLPAGGSASSGTCVQHRSRVLHCGQVRRDSAAGPL
jgi:hypothetical protein